VLLRILLTIKDVTQSKPSSVPKRRGAAWTEERRRSDEGRRRLKSDPEASGQTQLVTLVLLVLRTAGNLQKPVRTLLHFGKPSKDAVTAAGQAARKP
jgi:hypothetical protein